MKKILSMLLGICIGFALAGCAGGLGGFRYNHVGPHHAMSVGGVAPVPYGYGQPGYGGYGAGYGQLRCRPGDVLIQTPQGPRCQVGVSQYGYQNYGQPGYAGVVNNGCRPGDALIQTPRGPQCQVGGANQYGNHYGYQPPPAYGYAGRDNWGTPCPSYTVNGRRVCQP